MKYFVKDEDGKEYEINEVDSEPEQEEDKLHDDASSLSEEEITALKSLASVAGKLVELVNGNAKPEDEDVVTDDEDTDEDVLDTDKETKNELVKSGACDSRKSFGAKESYVNDSKLHDAIDRELKISEAWSKRGIKGGN